jgi:hypothetical protein
MVDPFVLIASLSQKNVSGVLAVKRKYYRSSSSSFNGFSSVCIFFEFDFKPFSDAYKSETLSRGIKSVFGVVSGNGIYSTLREFYRP